MWQPFVLAIVLDVVVWPTTPPTCGSHIPVRAVPLDYYIAPTFYDNTPLFLDPTGGARNKWILTVQYANRPA